MTYRQDSDIPRPYGTFIRRETRDDDAVDALVSAAASRPGTVAWLASNCHTASGREDFVAELSNHTAVDVYGACGRPCDGGRPAKEEEDGCSRMLSGGYRFYLALENSACRDYVTEKFWRRLDDGLVPVVAGGGVGYAAMAPPGSYVDAADFGSARELAQFLEGVTREEYEGFHAWRYEYEVSRGAEQKAWSMCELCRMLHEDKGEKVYEDMHGWWVEGAECRTRKE